MSKVKIPKGVTHYFQNPQGEVSYFLDSKMGVIFNSDGRLHTIDDTWKGAEGVARMAGILTGRKMIKVNIQLENK